MTDVLVAFLIAFAFSFVGTIPPGTLSLSIIQLGLDHRISAAWRMALAAAIIEYPYAWVAVEFQDFIRQHVELTDHFRLLGAAVMLLLGILNLISSSGTSRFRERFDSSGFRRGVVLSVLNPLAIPFWMAVTAWLKTYGWVDLSSQLEVHAYLCGVSAGTLVLFMLLAILARKLVSDPARTGMLKKIPGVLLIALGLYEFSAYISG